MVGVHGKTAGSIPISIYREEISTLLMRVCIRYTTHLVTDYKRCVCVCVYVHVCV